MTHHKLKRKAIGRFLLTATLGLSLSTALMLSSCQTVEAPNETTYTVKKDQLKLYIQETGWMGSAEEIAVRAPFDSPLVSIVPEGQVVKKGDKLGKLESSTQAQEKETQQLAVQEAQVDTRLTQHEKGVEKARLSYEREQAKLQESLEKLRLDQLKTERDQAELTRLAAGLKALEQRMRMLKLESEERDRLFKLGYLSQQERDQSALDLKLAAEEKTQLLAELKVAKAGPAATVIARQQKQWEFARQQQQRLSQEAKIQQKVLAVQAKAAARKTQRLKSNLKYYQDMIAASQLVSPAAGTVVYGKLQVGQDLVPIKAGDSLKEGVEILKIVNLKRPLIRLTLHEIDAPRVALNQRAEIRLDAYPETVFYGKVSRLLPVARTQESNDLLGLRGVAGEITLEPGFPEDLLRPGMTCSVRIEVFEKPAVMQVPTAALFHEEDTTYCWVKQGKDWVKQAVETGVSSIEHTEILSGLSVGDEVKHAL